MASDPRISRIEHAPWMFREELACFAVLAAVIFGVQALAAQPIVIAIQNLRKCARVGSLAALVYHAAARHGKDPDSGLKSLIAKLFAIEAVQ